MPGRVRHLIFLVCLLSISAAGVAADRSTAVTGTVRDVLGVPQMGVMVELLGPGVAASVLTDLQGRYVLSGVLPGVYQIRASATLFLPALRRQLRVTAGARPVVNLTMSGILDEAAWLPTKRRGPSEAADDWAWTLRSPSNRPMLRLVGDEASGSTRRHGESSSVAERHGHIAASASAGGFGTSSRQISGSIAQRKGKGQTEDLLRVVAGQDSRGGISLTAVSAMVRSGEAQIGPQRRTFVSYRMLPQITIQGLNARRTTQGMGVLEFSSAQRMQMGEFGTVEFGTQTQLLRAGLSSIVFHPFLQIASQPIGGWTVSYALATSPSFSEFDSVGESDSRVPVVAPAREGLLTESGTHQELRARRRIGKLRLQLAYVYDDQQRAVLTGVLHGTAAVADGPQAYSARNAMVDLDTGAFQSLAHGYSGGGTTLLVDVPLGEELLLTGGYLTGEGLEGLGPAQKLDPTTEPTGLTSKRSQAVLIGVQGKVTRTGTRVWTAYRWQPARVATVLSPYESADITPYLSVHVRQRIAGPGSSTTHMELTLDGTNVLREGYQKACTRSGDAVLTSALQRLSAGLAFTF